MGVIFQKDAFGEKLMDKFQKMSKVHQHKRIKDLDPDPKFKMKLSTSIPHNVAKVCFAQCSTSRLALGSPGCSFVRSFVTMPRIPYKTL